MQLNILGFGNGITQRALEIWEAGSLCVIDEPPVLSWDDLFPVFAATLTHIELTSGTLSILEARRTR